MSMHPDLEWLARNVSEWGVVAGTYDRILKYHGGVDYCQSAGCDKDGKFNGVQSFTKPQWQAARQKLGLDKFITPEEERTHSETEPMTPEEEEMPAEEWSGSVPEDVETTENRSDGSTASYYRLPEGSTELQHLISYRNMNSQIGEIFRACYRFGLASHSDQLRDAKKILFYAQAEVERLEAPRSRELEK